MARQYLGKNLVHFPAPRKTSLLVDLARWWGERHYAIRGLVQVQLCGKSDWRLAEIWLKCSPRFGPSSGTSVQLDISIITQWK